MHDNNPTCQQLSLPHHELLAYGVARDLVLAVVATRIRDSKLRDEALRAAKSAALNTAEGAGRVSPADKARALAIARGRYDTITFRCPSAMSRTAAAP